jgi:hypothetical protein
VRQDGNPPSGFFFTNMCDSVAQLFDVFPMLVKMVLQIPVFYASDGMEIRQRSVDLGCLPIE